jgi:hypothetical protein
LGLRTDPVPGLLARRLIESISKSKHEHMARKPLLLTIALQKPKQAQKTATAVSNGGNGSLALLPSSDEFRVLPDSELQRVREIVTTIEKMAVW